MAKNPASVLKTKAKKPPSDVRLYIPDGTTFEVWEDDICRLRLGAVKQIVLDNGRNQSVVKVA